MHLFEPLGLVLQLDLPGLGVVLGQAAPLARVLRLQLEELQVLQLSTQVLYQLREGGERGERERGRKGGGDGEGGDREGEGERGRDWGEGRLSMTFV